MSWNLSTTLKNYLLKGGSFKHAFNDCCVKVYTGEQPDTADDVATGTLMATLSRDAETFAAGTVSTAKIDIITITAGATSDIYTVTINGTAYTYTQLAGATAASICAGLAAVVDADADVIAVPVTNTTEKVIAIRSRYPGETFTISVSKTGGTGSIATAVQTANARAAGLHFATPSSGSISKESAYMWRGTCVAAGEMGWFRILSNDGLRMLDGEIGEDGSGLEMIVADQTRIVGQEISITSITLTI